MGFIKIPPIAKVLLMSVNVDRLPVRLSIRLEFCLLIFGILWWRVDREGCRERAASYGQVMPGSVMLEFFYALFLK